MATRARSRLVPRLPKPLAPGRGGVILLLALFAGAALVSGFSMLRQVDPFDEGLVLQAARRVSQGQAPYRDFLWAYGPAQPYLLAALFKLFGVSLLQWRILRVLADAGIAVVTFVLVRRFAGPRWGLLAWLAAAAQMAEPRSANPFPFALLGALAALWCALRRTRWAHVGAGLLIALAAAFRLDFAIYGFVAVLVLLALERRPLRSIGAFAAVAVGGSALLYLPFLVLVGPADLYDALVGTSLRERHYWTLPFPWSYHGGFSGPKDAKHLLDFYVPALLVVGLVVAGVAAALRRALVPLWLALGAFGLGCLSYLLSRTDEFHTAPLLVTLAVLLPAVAAWAWRERSRVVAAAAAVVFALLLLHGVANRASALLRPPAMSTIHVAVADGAEAPPAEARAIERVVAVVHSRVPPGQPIYVAPLRSDLVRFNDPLLYVLTERDNPTYRDFGLLTGAAAQARIVADLERARPRVVIRWTDPISAQREPNLRGRPSGVHTLDTWLAAHYRVLQRLYHYTILVPR